jgi:hypothetical protein
VARAAAAKAGARGAAKVVAVKEAQKIFTLSPPVLDPNLKLLQIIGRDNYIAVYIYIFETGKVESSRVLLRLCSVRVVRVVVVRRCLMEVGASRVGVGPPCMTI